MKYILDRDTISYLLKGDLSVRNKVQSIPIESLCTTIINYSELMYGIELEKSSRKIVKYITELLKAFEILQYTSHAALIFAKTKAELKNKGELIMDFDLMIASIAIANKYTLVTNNEKHFQRISSLKIENWSKHSDL